MASESGDKKLLGNFRKLIDQISADPNYNPANPKLAKTALEAQYTNGEAAADDVSTKAAPNKLAITDRQSAFANLRPLALRSRNFLKSSGTPKEVVADAETYIRKISGVRKSAKIKDDPAGSADKSATPGGESKGSRSASQMSYDNQLGHLGAYFEILKNVQSYNPNENDLKLTSLEAFAASLKAKNHTVSTTSAALSQARGLRDRLLYLNDDSIVNTALLVKSYVSAALGTNSQLNRLIKGLEFTRQRKRG